jgi:23S rRNA (guanine745-N1)-methyltransferase
MWQCPLCKLPLKTVQENKPNLPYKTWFCENKHTFDKAKQGYVNLLPVQNKRSKMPGDDAEMVAARTRFFSAKPYRPLAIKLSELMRSLVSSRLADNLVSRNLDELPPESIKIYDSGCGEGYYLEAISESLSDQFLFAGHDISKAAVVAAARRNKDKQLVVASTINIPVVDQSQDIILQVFAPSCASEYIRVLKPCAYVITVDPAPEHLFELKQMVYDSPQLHDENKTGLEGFDIVEEHDLRFQLNLDNAEMRLALLMMTPFYWKTDDNKRARIQMELQRVTADFRVTVWQAALEVDSVEESTI